MDSRQAEILSRFKKETATHEMDVLLDSGTYRHLRFRRPGTYCMGFDITTWPGYLAITGYMGAAVFCRTEDMFKFFRAKPAHHERDGGLHINEGYWAEKCQANDGDQKQFDPDMHAKFVRERFDEYMADQNLDEIENGHALAADLWDEIERGVLDAHTTDHAIHLAGAFEPEKFSDIHEAFGDFRFHDYWDCASSLESYTYHFTWRLYAIAHAIKTYDEREQAVTS